MNIRATIAGVFLVGSTASAQVFAGHDMTLNGSGGGGTPVIVGGVLELLNNDYGAATSAFTTGTYDFSTSSAWSTSFTLYYAWTSAINGFGDIGGDGVAFVMQGGAASALGVGGGEIGYGGIGNSIAVSFRSFWDDVLFGQDGNVSAQTGPSPAGLVLNPGEDYFLDVTIGYDGPGHHLTVEYTRRERRIENYQWDTDDLSSLGPTVRVGFTAGTGAATQQAQVTSWEFSGLKPTDVTATPEPATVGLVATGVIGLGASSRRRRRA